MGQIVGSTITYSGTFLSMMLIAILLENTLLTRALGTSTVILILRKKANYFLFCIVLTFITLLSSLAVYFMNPLFEASSYAYYIRPIIYVAIISILYLVVLLIVGRFPKEFRQKIQPMIHLSVFNCAVLGAILLASSLPLTLFTAIGFGLGSGIGFFLATFLLAGSYRYLNSDNIPLFFRGFPITMIFVGILSLALYGVIGHQLPV